MRRLTDVSLELHESGACAIYLTPAEDLWPAPAQRPDLAHSLASRGLRLVGVTNARCFAYAGSRRRPAPASLAEIVLSLMLMEVAAPASKAPA